MKQPKPFSSFLSHSRTRYFIARSYPLIMAQTRTSPDSIQPEEHPARNLTLTGDAHVQRAWAHWTNLGRPKLIVAPMVDNSELPFRLLCKKYGAQAAYTPMLHSRIFSETEKYRKEEFTTCKVLTPSVSTTTVIVIVVLLWLLEFFRRIDHFLFNSVLMILMCCWKQHVEWSLIVITLILILGNFLFLLLTRWL